MLVGALAGGFAGPSRALASDFSYTGAEQSWPVPPGVDEVRVVAVGAPGGGDNGGQGAVVSADVRVPPGAATLSVEVGGPGSLPLGGFNGGGDGGIGSEGLYPAFGGGGASDVRSCSSASGSSCATNTLASRLVVAAGGGGQASDGYAGGNAGEAGDGVGGMPGTLTAGGRGGAQCIGPADGGLGQGGPGQGGSSQGPGSSTPSGGGGGGGYYGGGGGGSSDELCFDGFADGGGGGGSSFAADGPLTQTLDARRVPHVTITGLVAETVSLDLHSARNIGYAQAIGSRTLTDGQARTMTVQGTGSVWGPGWNGSPNKVCGTPRSAPLFGSTPTSASGAVGLDPEYLFARPVPQAATCPTLPEHRGEFRISLDGGAHWLDPAPSSVGRFIPSTNSLYTYEVIGHGQPLMMRYFDRTTSDNYGRFVARIW
jgi:hypothetical protein